MTMNLHVKVNDADIFSMSTGRQAFVEVTGLILSSGVQKQSQNFTEKRKKRKRENGKEHT